MSSPPSQTMAPLASNLTISYPSYSEVAALNNATPTAVNTSSEPSSDFTGTIIFGVIASVLAIMAIIVGYLQLRKASSPPGSAPSGPAPPAPANQDV